MSLFTVLAAVPADCGGTSDQISDCYGSLPAKAMIVAGVIALSGLLIHAAVTVAPVLIDLFKNLLGQLPSTDLAAPPPAPPAAASAPVALAQPPPAPASVTAPPAAQPAAAPAPSLGQPPAHAVPTALQAQPPSGARTLAAPAQAVPATAESTTTPASPSTAEPAAGARPAPAADPTTRNPEQPAPAQMATTRPPQLTIRYTPAPAPATPSTATPPQVPTAASALSPAPPVQAAPAQPRAAAMPAPPAPPATPPAASTAPASPTAAQAAAAPAGTPADQAAATAAQTAPAPISQGWPQQAFDPELASDPNALPRGMQGYRNLGGVPAERVSFRHAAQLASQAPPTPGGYRLTTEMVREVLNWASPGAHALTPTEQRMLADYQQHLTDSSGQPLPQHQLDQKIIELRNEGARAVGIGNPEQISNGRYAGQLVRIRDDHLNDLARNRPRLAQEIASHGVYINLHGFPDFIPYARAVVELPDQLPTDPAGNPYPNDVLRRADISTCDKILTGMCATDLPLLDALQKRHTWHHLEGTRTLICIPREVHEGVRHFGGIATAASAATPAATTPAASGSGPARSSLTATHPATWGTVDQRPTGHTVRVKGQPITYHGPIKGRILAPPPDFVASAPSAPTEQPPSPSQMGPGGRQSPP